jgi:hypothetical protein
MSGADATLLLNTQFGNLSALLASKQTIWSNRSFDTTNIFAVDNTYVIPVTGQEADFGQQARFKIQKRGGKVHKSWLRITIAAETAKQAGVTAAYSDDLAAAIIGNVRLSYASKTLQEYGGEPLKMYNRLMKHDIFREMYNGMAFAGLPPGGAFEVIRQGNLTSGVILYVPLDWLYYTRFEDYSLHPEALASDLDLEILYEPLSNCVYARDNAGNPITTATGIWTTVAGQTGPKITKTELFQQLVHVPVPEKNMNLMTYEKDQGNLFKILDLETQLNFPVAATFSGPAQVRLDNFRLDSQFIMFMVRDAAVQTPFTLDNMQSSTNPTVLTGGRPVNGLLPITSFRLLANGSILVDVTTDVENRFVHREIYLQGSQAAEYIYFVPFSWLLKDAKNVTSFQNMANLGNVILEVTLAAYTSPITNAAAARTIDVYSVTHNIIQWKRGDVVKALR